MRLPEKFLQAAQEQGVEGKLDALIVQSSIQRVMQHNASQCALHVNLAVPDKTLLDALPQNGVHLSFEVSEQQVAAEPGRYLDFAAACRSRGYRVGLAHFGWGQLPLRVLAEMRPDFVKISVADLRESGAHRGEPDVLPTMVQQAHHLSSFVIAEAIETQSEREWLAASGVDALQGWAISSPLAEEDFFIWLRRYA
jgi:EAL domain-containing protein (putative c-di-GMP-specific phosphodiesterase class I)